MVAARGGAYLRRRGDGEGDDGDDELCHVDREGCVTHRYWQACVSKLNMSTMRKGIVLPRE